MIKKDFLFLGLLSLVVTGGVIVVNTSQTEVTRKDILASDRAVAEAEGLYRVALKSGWDLTRGPCLSNDLMPGWVADLVHNPKTTEDDNLSNQCPAYLEGRAHHFVELDLGGNVVRVK